MCILTLVYHFYEIKWKWKKYQKLKERSRRGVEEIPPMGKFEKYWSRFRNRYRSVSKRYRKILKYYLLENPLSHFTVVAVAGWVLGSLFAVMHFYNSIARGNGDVFLSFLLKLPMIVLLTLAISFTEKGRCMMLLVPSLVCSAKGQIYIQGMVMLYIMTGPVVNLNHNMSVIRESSSCQQHAVAEAAAEIADILFGPFSSFKQAAMEIVNGIKIMVGRLQAVLANFKRTAMAVADAIQVATQWINSKINGCKNSVGTTYQHCMGAFTWMYDECKVSVPSIFVKLCAVTEFASNLCSSVKPGEYLCDLVYFNIDPLITTVSQRISRLLDRAYTLMYFSVNIHHEFHIDSNRNEIMEEIKEKVKEAVGRVPPPSNVANFMEVLFFFLNFMYIFYVYMYRSSYLRRDSFDNYFITSRLKDIDHQEGNAGRETIFPLRRKERQKYIRISSVRIVGQEMKQLAFPMVTILKVFIFIAIVGLDYLLFYVTDYCRIFMLAVMQSFASRTEISIEGSGFLAELSRRVIRALNYMDYNFYQAHFMPCIPNPRPPNNWTTFLIFFWIVVFIFSWAFKPYVLRFRHVVMDYYHPDIADRRARWLYNHILFKRMTFVKVIGTKMRGRYGGDQNSRMFSLADYLRAKYPLITYIIGKGLIGSNCRICNHVVPPLYSCPTRNCPGIYCDDCYVSIQGVCCICRQEMMADDFKGRPFEKIVLDEEEIAEIKDEAEGFFEVIDDETDLDYSYQNYWQPPESETGYETTEYNFDDYSTDERLNSDSKTFLTKNSE